jgi:hypothetical protein
MKRNSKSRVMTIANKLVGKGYSRSVAMVKAWIIAKAERLSVRVTGTTFNNRQSVLKAIDGKPAQIKLVHETDNLADRNAVSVWVFAEGTRGYYRIGYLPKLVALVLAPILDKGESLELDRVTVVGEHQAGFNFGARLELAV